jgi:hypothetical protein
MFGLQMLAQSVRNWENALTEYGEAMMTANEVIWRRSLALVTGTLPPSEAVLMVLEKPAAFALAAHNAGEAATHGGDFGTIASAAIAPLHVKADTNARRLRS